MSRRLLIALAAVALSLTAFVGATSGAPPQMFVTPLNGGEEVPARPTHAHGVAIFQLNPEGTELSYRLIASNINNVFASHIHLGQPGANGGVVVFLFEGAVASGRHNGVLATGTITEDDLINALLDQPMSVLIGHLMSGNAYVNVHTSMPGAPSGAGNFPGGEIRGQID